MSFVIVEGDVTLRSAGVELATDDATALVSGARGFIGVGYDGTNTRFIRVDSSGYQIMVGAGTAGTPAGGVVSVQGVSGGQAMPVEIEGTVSTVNSTSTPLGIGGTFTGTAEDVSGVAIVFVTVFTNVASATNGLSVQQSSDGTNWDHVEVYTIPANTAKTFSFQAACQFFRIAYTNGGTAQTTFRLQTVFKQVYGKPSSHRISDNITTQDDAELVKAVLAGNSLGKFYNISATPGGLLATATAGQAVSAGVVDGTAGVISGRVTTAATTRTAIRNTAYMEQSVNAQRSVSSTSASDTAAGTGARTVRLTYFARSGGTITGPFTEDVTLNGTTPVNTSNTNICYIDRIEVITAGSGGVNAGTIQLFTGLAGGGSVFASVAAGERRTYYAHHYVASGLNLFIEGLYASSTASTLEFPEFTAVFRNPTVADAAERMLIDHLVVQGTSGIKSQDFDVPKNVDGPAVVIFYVTPTSIGSQVNRVDCEFVEV